MVEPSEQLLAGRLQRARERLEGGARRLRLMPCPRDPRGLPIGREEVGEHHEEVAPVPGGEGGVAGKDVVGELEPR